MAQGTQLRNKQQRKASIPEVCVPPSRHLPPSKIGRCHLVCGQRAGDAPKDPEAEGTSRRVSRAQQTLGKKRLHFSYSGLPSGTQRARDLTGQTAGKSNCTRGAARVIDAKPATPLRCHLPGFLFPSVQNSLHLFKFWLLPCPGSPLEPRSSAQLAGTLLAWAAHGLQGRSVP